MTKILTPKQLKFVEEYLRGGNASAAYRLAYDAGRMSPETIRKRAQEMLRKGAIKGRLAELREKTAEAAVVDRLWVISTLVENCEIAMGRKTTKKTVKGSGEDAVLATVQVYDRDAAAANAALKLLGQLPEVGLFAEPKAVTVNVTNVPQAPPEDRIAEIVSRFRLPRKDD